MSHPHRHDADEAGYDGAAAATQGRGRPATIFRAGARRDYTKLPNKTINDPALGIEHVGALGRLLALPDDWQMHPWEIRKRWGVGRDKYYAVLRVLMDAGYIVRGEMIRGEQGSFVAIEYLVFDEPQAVEAGVAPDDDGAPPPRPAPDDPAPPEGVTSLPHPGLPHTAEPHTAEPDAVVKNNNNNHTPPTPPDPEHPPAHGADPLQSQAVVPLRTADPPVAGTGSGPPSPGRRGGDRAHPPPAPAAGPNADEFLAAWRTQGGECISADRARKLWLRVAAAERAEAVAALPAFRRDRERRKWRWPDAGTYLKDRLWRRFDLSAPPSVHELSPSMPEWHRWCEHFERTGKAVMLREMKRLAGEGKTFPALSRWPPAAESAAEADGDNDTDTDMHEGGEDGEARS